MRYNIDVEGEIMNYTQTLREFCKQNQGHIFDVQYEQNHRFSLVPYKTLLKILNRLEEEKIVSSWIFRFYGATCPVMTEPLNRTR
jgi:hypothetical protein